MQTVYTIFAHTHMIPWHDLASICANHVAEWSK